MRRLLLSFAIVFTSLSGFAQMQGRARLDSLLGSLVHAKQDTARVRLLANICYHYHSFDADSGLLFCDQALELAHRLKWPPGEYMSWFNIGVNHQMRGNYGEALKHFEQAREIQRVHPKGINEGKLLSELMLSNFYQGDHIPALEFGHQALKVFESTNDREGAASVHNNLGNLHLNLKAYDRSIYHLGLALDHYRSTGDKEKQARALGNIANIHIEMGQLDQALGQRLQALKLYEDLGHTRGMVINYVNTASTYNRMNDQVSALRMIEKAIPLAVQLDHKITLGGIQETLGGIYLKAAEKTDEPSNEAPFNISRKERYGKARQHLENALAIREAAGQKHYLANTLEGLSQIHEADGDPREALRYHRQATALRDSLMNADKLVQAERMQAQRERELREKDALLRSAEMEKAAQERSYLIAVAILLVLFSATLYSRSRLKVRKDREFYKHQQVLAEREKEIFQKQMLEIEMRALRSQMDPHFIFNCMNSIQALIVDGDKRTAMDYLGKFSRLLRAILDNSCKYSNSLEEEIEVLGLYLALEKLRMEERFTWSINCDEEIDRANTDIPSMVIQPLVENSLWHGAGHAARPVHISVSFERKGEQLLCIVADDGIGRQKARELDQRRGHASQGLRSIEERLQAWSRIRNVGCRVRIDDPPDGAGTRTIIVIDRIDMLEPVNELMEQLVSGSGKINA